MFQKVLEQKDVRRGDFLALFKSKEVLTRYLATIFSGAPVWLFAGLFMTFSPELQKALNIADPLPAPPVIMISAIGLTLGDVLFGALSQYLKSRKKAFYAAFALMASAIIAMFTLELTATSFYWLMFIGGLGAGYWAVFVTTAGETFGTNLRGTVAITAPSFVRGMVIPFTLGRAALLSSLGFLGATAAVSILVFALAIWAVMRMPETYGSDLDFVEQPSA
jgi:MFS family permease